MNFYTTLGIKKTAGVQEIKRAYAAKLKLHRPDDDPVQFQAINTAYQFALDNAKRRESFAAMNPESRQSNLVTAADDGQNEQYDYEDDDFFSGEEPEFDQDNHDHDRYRVAMMSDALKAPSAFAPAPAPESQTESGPMDRNEFDIDEFMSEFMQAATVKNPNMATWLQNHPALFSIELKDWLCEPILDHLEMQPTLKPQVLKDIFHFFDLDTLNQKSAWIGPRIEMLYEKSRVEYPWEDLSFIDPSKTRHPQSKAYRQSSDSEVPWRLILIGLWIVFSILRNI